MAMAAAMDMDSVRESNQSGEAFQLAVGNKSPDHSCSSKINPESKSELISCSRLYSSFSQMCNISSTFNRARI